MVGLHVIKSLSEHKVDQEAPVRQREVTADQFITSSGMFNRTLFLLSSWDTMCVCGGGGDRGGMIQCHANSITCSTDPIYHKATTIIWLWSLPNEFECKWKLVELIQARYWIFYADPILGWGRKLHVIKATNFCVRFIYVNYVSQASAGHINLYRINFYRAICCYVQSARTHN